LITASEPLPRPMRTCPAIRRLNPSGTHTRVPREQCGQRSKTTRRVSPSTVTLIHERLNISLPLLSDRTA
jgi:hypothetical protein